MDKDILKKAVELADGHHWRTLADWLTANDYPIEQAKWNDEIQRELDALAAQLVHQVDALEPTKDEKIILTVYHDATDIHAEFRQGLSGYRDIISVPGKDRTDNTITAVVESKVLEKGKGE